MSYDLYFYKRKENKTTEQEIAEYLTANFVPPNETGRQWFFGNEDTEAYFSIDQNEPETDEEAVELFEKFDDFNNTHFSFNLNFLRPDFFGQFAFEHVDKFVEKFDLYVLNPQSSTDADKPIKPQPGSLYKNWSQTNAEQSANLFRECESVYYPLEKTNDFYLFNSNRKRIQAELGEDYFVPKIFLFQRKSDGHIISTTIWPEHIPCIFPQVDYLLLCKKYKKWFRAIEEDGFISSETFHTRFGSYLDDYGFMNCKILHPDKAEQLSDIFNSTKIEHKVVDFAERIAIEKVSNVRPSS